MEDGNTGLRDRLLAGVPVRERRIAVNGVDTAVLEGGAGPPIVLLHGGIECGGVYWAPVLAGLGERHRLVVPDLPGLGESAPVPRLDPTVFADWLAALFRELGIERPAVVAHSLTGSLAVHFAVRHGRLLDRLVIYAAPAVGRYRMPLGLRVAAIRFGLRPTGRNIERFARWAVHDLDRVRRQNPVWMDAFLRYNVERAGIPHVKRTMTGMIRTCTRQVPAADLLRLTAPVSLLWGRHDRMVPVAVGQGASTALGWPLHVDENAGHAAHIERPDRFCDLLSKACATAAGGP